MTRQKSFVLISGLVFLISSAFGQSKSTPRSESKIEFPNILGFSPDGKMAYAKSRFKGESGYWVQDLSNDSKQWVPEKEISKFNINETPPKSGLLPLRHNDDEYSIKIFISKGFEGRDGDWIAFLLSKKLGSKKLGILEECKQTSCHENSIPYGWILSPVEPRVAVVINLVVGGFHNDPTTRQLSVLGGRLDRGFKKNYPLFNFFNGSSELENIGQMLKEEKTLRELVMNELGFQPESNSFQGEKYLRIESILSQKAAFEVSSPDLIWLVKVSDGRFLNGLLNFIERKRLFSPAIEEVLMSKMNGLLKQDPAQRRMTGGRLPIMGMGENHLKLSLLSILDFLKAAKSENYFKALELIILSDNPHAPFDLKLVDRIMTDFGISNALKLGAERKSLDVLQRIVELTELESSPPPRTLSPADIASLAKIRDFLVHEKNRKRGVEIVTYENSINVLKLEERWIKLESKLPPLAQ